MSYEPLSVVAGQYQIVRSLGAGGMGQVLLARDLSLHRMVALKILNADFADRADFAERFRQEARLGARLQHAGIVPVYSFGEADGKPFLIMQYLPGGSVGDRLRDEGALEAGETRSILADLAAALAYAHGEGVVHRDLKPDNILLTGNEDHPRPVLGDFGVAMRPMQDHGPGERRLLFGTAHYMSPEQSAGELDVDGRTDLFALGVLGYQMLAGAVPYDGNSEAAIAAARIRQERVPLAKAAPHAPAELVQAIERCLEVDPARRWQRASELEAELRRQMGTPIPVRKAGPTPVPGRKRRRALEATATLAGTPSHGLSLGERIVSRSVSGVQLAARSLGRTPTVSIAALLCLALGIGATTAIFSAVNTALLKPLPFANPSELVTVYRTTPHFTTGPFAAANFLDLRSGTTSLQQLAAVTSAVGLIESETGSERVPLFRVSGDFFPLLGVTALKGRMLTRSDEDMSRPDVIVLSEEFWRSRYGADNGMVGRSLMVNGKPHEVVGIAPRGLRVLHGAGTVTASLWVPLRFTPVQAAVRNSNFLLLLGRLKPGRTVEDADRELHVEMDRLVAAYPEMRGESARAAPLASEGVRGVKKPLLLLLGAVAFVLLIAAANVASLLLARGAERRREVSIRTALGASRRAILGQVLRESLVLAGTGAGLGILLAWGAVKAIGATASRFLPSLAGLSVDWRVLTFALLVTALVALLSGILPAWRASDADPQDALRAGGTRIGAGTSHHRYLRGLIVTEVALALVLLLSAGLVLRGFIKLSTRDPGFESGRLLTLVANVSDRRYQDTDAYPRFLLPALDAIKRIPGVADAGAISLMPMFNWGNNSNVRYEGSTEQDRTKLPLVEFRRVSPSWFSTFQVTLLKGRLLTEDDRRPGAPQVVVVNRALMERDFGGRDPVGSRFIEDTTSSTIVGVIADIANVGPFSDPAPEMYLPYEVNYTTSFPIAVRVTGDPAAVSRQVTEAIQSVDATAAVSLVRPMEQVMANAVGQPRFYLVLIGAFAAVALLLSLAGLYGLTSYAVATRTREIGIRTALGATPGQSVRLVVREGALLVGTGLLIGGVLGLGVTRLLGGFLYGVSPLDPTAWAAVAAALAGTGVLATVVPARRASRVDPLVAIRSE